MTFTYSGVPVAGTTDEIRFLIQDTDSTNAIFQDEEIQYYVSRWQSVNGSAFKTAASLCETAAAKYAREVTISSDATSVAMEQLQQKYEELAARLRSMAGEIDMSGNGPIVGGTNSDDWYYGGPPKTFQRKMNDNPLAGEQETIPAPLWQNDYEYGGFWDGG